LTIDGQDFAAMELLVGTRDIETFLVTCLSVEVVILISFDEFDMDLSLLVICGNFCKLLLNFVGIGINERETDQKKLINKINSYLNSER